METNNKIREIAAVKTGVFTINHFPGVFEDLMYHTVNIDLETRETEYFSNLRTEYDLPENYDFDEDPRNVVNRDELEALYEESDSDTKLIGFKKNEERIYIEDPEAEYSCQFGELWGAVTRSKYICQCNKGSPCIPYQCDLETKGSEWAFTLPPEVFGEDKPEWMEIIKLDHEVKNLTGILLEMSKNMFIPY